VDESDVAPEIEVPAPEPEIADQPIPAPSLDGTGEIDDEQVSDWLESLAAGTLEEIEPVPTVQQFLSQQPTIETEVPEAIEEDRELPEEPEESLQWLEDLAEKRGIEVEVPEAEPTQPPIAEPPLPGTAEWDETPDWLKKVAPREAESTVEEPAADLEVDVEKPEPIEDVIQPDLEPEEPTLEKEPTVVEVEETFEPTPAKPVKLEAEPPPAVEPSPPVEMEDVGITPPEEEPTWIEPDETVTIQEVEAEAEVPEWLRAPVDAQPTPPEAEQPVPDQVEPIQPVVEQAIPEVPVEVPKEEPPPEPPTIKEPPTQEIFETARKALASGDHDKAVEQYGLLIKQRIDMDKVIEDLRLALDRTPSAAKLWQALGDAFMREDNTAEAIEAYQKGMEAS
jgi:hypothetical protein